MVVLTATLSSPKVIFTKAQGLYKKKVKKKKYIIEF